MKNALTRVSSKSSLFNSWLKLWKKVRPKSRANHGVDGISLFDFERTHQSRIHDLSYQIRSGNYTPSPLRPDFIDKGGGKYRVICVPTTGDRVVQGSLLNFLQDHYHERFNNRLSYGFIKGKTVKSALTHATTLRKQHPWVFKTDITSFFDRIPRDILQTRIRKIIREKTLHPILGKVVYCEIYSDSRSVTERIARQGIKTGIGVRQGMPLSPFFSNLLLDRFDDAVQRAGLKAIRYADDLIFFADSLKECQQIDAFCRVELNEEKLEIPQLGLESKSQIYAPEKEADFLGAALTLKNGEYHITLPEARIQKILNVFLDMSNIEELVARKISLGKLTGILSAKRAGYDHAYEMCENVDHLHERLENVEQKVLKKIYTEQLGINLSSLRPVAHRFLGLLR